LLGEKVKTRLDINNERLFNNHLAGRKALLKSNRERLFRGGIICALRNHNKTPEPRLFTCNNKNEHLFNVIFIVLCVCHARCIMVFIRGAIWVRKKKY